MNRQQFLRRSALLSLAATGIPRMAAAMETDDRSKETYYKSTPVRRRDDSYLQYSTHFNFDDLIEKDATSPPQVIITISEFSSPTVTTGPTCLYTLERVGLPKIDGDYTTMKFKLVSTEGKDVLNGAFPKSLSMHVAAGKETKLYIGKNSVVEMKHYEPDDADCFLTTACTAARGLADDCAELTTLRRLRDGFMRPSPCDAALVEEYYRIAPTIVRSVNARINRQEIWNLVYSDLVTPAVDLISTGKQREAVQLYGEYVGWSTLR